MGKDVRIAVRVTAIEKEKIQAKARKCGLSVTEYVKQRALGYEPRTVPPDALFACLEKLGYKNHSGVLKRIRKIGQAYEAYTGVDYGFESGKIIG